jgi:hypothetical protein
MEQPKTSTNVQEKVATDIVRHDDHVENAPPAKDAVIDAATRGQALTGYETLTPWQTFQKFKWCTFFAFLAAFSAGADGYQIGYVTLLKSSTMRLRF